jgi:outer membrane protein
MKKFTILAIAICASFTTYAQYNQGRMLVGGSLGFSAETEKTKFNGNTQTDGKWTSFSLAPQFGYFIIDNLAVGASLDLGLSKWKDEADSDDDYSVTSIEFIPTVRYYLPQNIFFQGQVGFGTSKYKYGSGTVDEEKYSTISFALAAGYAFFLNDNVAIEPMIGYGSSSEKDKDTDVKYIDNGLFLRVGIQVYLGQ